MFKLKRTNLAMKMVVDFVHLVKTLHNAAVP